MAFSCGRCGYEFKAKHHLKQHLTRQTVCEASISDKTYATLLSEEFVPKVKPYKCSYCEKTFTQQSNKSRHQSSCLHKPEVPSIREPENAVLVDATEFAKMKEDIDKMKTVISQSQSYPISFPTPKKKNKIPQSIRALAWNTHIGVATGQTLCLCCKKNNISQLEFVCGHVLAHSQGGSIAIENLRPICQKCNIDMSDEHMFQFAQRIHGVNMT
jgi:hypothetical protein